MRRRHLMYPQQDKDLAVCPITASDLCLQRAGRVLLDIPRLVLGQLSPTTGTVAKAAAITAIVGPNGAGKSVLIRTLCGLLTPDSGRIAWAGCAPDAARRHRVGLLLQKPVLLRRSAQANLIYALRQSGYDRKTSQAMSNKALEQSGLAELRDVPARRLSGGEQQRLALVRALLLKPDILFLDEATANVDPASTLAIEQQLLHASAEGLHVIMVSHDQAQVRRLADYLVLLHKGQVLEQASSEDFFNSPGHPLTHQWINGELLI